MLPKKGRTAILDDFVKTIGCHRKHATALLNGKREHAKHPIRRPRSIVYDGGLVSPVLILVDLFDGICSKRLRAAMNVELPRRTATQIAMPIGVWQKFLSRILEYATSKM